MPPKTHNRIPQSSNESSDIFSSPDPLASPFNTTVAAALSPSRRRSQSPVRQSQPQPPIRSNILGSRLQFSDILLATPTKRSPVKGQAEDPSPWRIRITVQAEPEGEEAGSAGAKVQTQTMRVPLRGADAESPTEACSKGRGPRKSTPTKSRRRSLTPGRRRRKSVTDLDITVLGDDDDEQPRAKKKRGRASRGNAAANGKKANSEEPTDKESTSPAQMENAKALKAKQATKRGDFDIALDEETGGEIDQTIETNENGLPQEDGCSLRELDLNRVSLRSKSLTRHRNQPSDQKVNGPKSLSPPTSTNIQARPASRQVSDSSHYPTPDSSVQDDEDAKTEEVPSERVPQVPTDEDAEFDTIMESEGFTMISLDTLSSTKQQSQAQNSRPVDTIEANNTSERHVSPSPTTPEQNDFPPPTNPHPDESIDRSISRTPLSAIPSHLRPRSCRHSLANSPDASSDISSSLPTPHTPWHPLPIESRTQIPQSLSRQEQTPTQPNPQSSQSPRPPPPPRMGFNTAAKATPPRLSRVVRAGIALQGVLTPSPRRPIHSQVQHQAPGRGTSVMIANSSAKQTQDGARERLDDLFGGFDSETRRELRAGLRFGEELARRASGAKAHSARSSPAVEYPDLSSAKSRSVERNNRQMTPEEKRLPGDRASAREREWQIEREAVSRRIEQAEESQIVVIDSDDENEPAERHLQSNSSPIGRNSQHDVSMPDAQSFFSERSVHNGHDVDGAQDQAEEEGEEEDIWLQEAHNSSNNSLDSPSHLEYHSSPPQPVVQISQEKPRRTLIPSPWKRGEDVTIDEDASSMFEPSGIFWQKQRSSGGTTSQRLSELVAWGKPRSSSSAMAEKQSVVNTVVEQEEEAKEQDILSGSVESRSKVKYEDEDADADAESVGEESVLISELNETETLDEQDNESELFVDRNSEEAEIPSEDPSSLLPSRRERPAHTQPAAPTDQSSSSLFQTVKRIPVIFHDDSTVSHHHDSTSPPAKTDAEHEVEDQQNTTQTRDRKQQCTPILKKTKDALAVGERGRSGSANVSPRRVSFSPLVKTRHFEEVSWSSSSSSGVNEKRKDSPVGRKGIYDDEEEEEGEEEEDQEESGGSWKTVGESSKDAAELDIPNTKDPEAKPSSSASSASSTWLGKVTGWFSSTSSSPAAPIAPALPISPSHPKMPAAANKNSNHASPPISTATPSPKADPLPRSGPFTNRHYRFLHYLHLLSRLRATSSTSPHRDAMRLLPPSHHETRPSVRALLGCNFDTAFPDAGPEEKFQWVVDDRAVRVVEGFLDGLERGVVVGDGKDGRVAVEFVDDDGVRKGEGKVEWSEVEIVKKLCSVVVGEVWRERKRAQHVP
ncbi:MAG: hypothetical protein Q9227_002156 [Pyrenula ochraceoflavens]